MFYQRGVASFKFGVPCFVVKKLKAKFLELKLLFFFGEGTKRKLSHVIKGRSDFYSGLTFLSEIWGMKIWILSSPWNNVYWRFVIHLFLALIVQCRYGLFAPKFCTNTILNFWVTTCQGIVQYANRSQGTLLDSSCKTII